MLTTAQDWDWSGLQVPRAAADSVVPAPPDRAGDERRDRPDGRAADALTDSGHPALPALQLSVMISGWLRAPAVS